MSKQTYPANLGTIDDTESLHAAAEELPLQGDAYADPARDNGVRARFAAKATSTYIRVTGSDDVEEAISDLLGDLRHLADAAGLDFGDMLTKSESYYNQELHGEL